MSFVFKKSLDGNIAEPVVRYIKLGNTKTVVVGEAVKIDTFSNGGGALRITAGDKVLGIVVSIVDSNGIDLDNTRQTLHGTWTSATRTYVSASDNLTVDGVMVGVVMDKNVLWYNVTAGTLAYADEYKFFDILSATQIADQNGADAAGAFQLIERDADLATAGLFRISESQNDMAVQQ